MHAVTVVNRIVGVSGVLAVGVLLTAGTFASQPGTLPASPGAPTKLWQVEGQGHGRPAGSPETVYFLSAQHEVVAIGAQSGAVRWRRGTSEPGPTTVGSAVALSGPVVVAGDYNLVAFDRITGAVRWRFVPAIGYGPGIYLGQTTPALVLAGSPAGRVYAIASLTGDLVWSTTIASDGRTTVFPPATDGADVAVVFTTFTAPPRGGVALLDLATGRERWRSAFPIAADPLLGTGSAGGPVLTDSLVIASSGDGTIHALDRRRGTVRWVAPAVAHYAWPSPETGPQPPPPTPSADHRPLALAGRLLVSGSLSSHVVAYDLASGRERWRQLDRPSGSVAFALTADDRQVYVPYVSGRHVALDSSNGTERWRTESRDGFSWPASAMDDRVYLAGTRGGFVAYRR